MVFLFGIVNCPWMQRQIIVLILLNPQIVFAFLQKLNIDSSTVNLPVDGNLSIPDRLSSEVAAAARAVWSDQGLAEKIASSSMDLITNACNRKFSFFSGKSSRGLLGGLFYLLGFRYGAVKKQKELAEKLGTTDVTIRTSYRKWLEEFPDLFTEVSDKITNSHKHFVSFNQVPCK
jgi:transcription initiation factor TFIIIB Brf1 subunit/transcription initiation factor TFIIB